MSCAIKQSGAITPGHALKWIMNGIAADAGGVANGPPGTGLTELGITNSGIGFSVRSAPSTEPYNSLDFGYVNGTPTIQISGNGGATVLNFVINGSTYSLPGIGTGNVIGPVSATVGDIATFNATNGELLADSGVQAVGGVLTIPGVVTGRTVFPNTGLTVGWDYTPSLGEVDLFLGPQGGNGGMKIFQLNSAGNVANSNQPTLTLSPTGDLGWLGNLTSNASSALVTPSGGNTALSIAAILAGTAMLAQSFGAKGDGVTDDTAAIQLALNTCAGKCPLIIPYTATKYLHHGLTIPDKTVLIVYGYLFLQNGSNTNCLYIAPGYNNIRILIEGTLDGNRANQATTGSQQAGGVVVDTNLTTTGTGLFVGGHGTIKNIYNWAVTFSGATNSEMRDLTITQCGNSTQFGNCIDCLADNLKISYINDECFAFYGGNLRCGLINSWTSYATASGVSLLNDSGNPAQNVSCYVRNVISHHNAGSGFEVARGSGASTCHLNTSISDVEAYANGTGNPANAGDINVWNGQKTFISNSKCHDSGGGSNGWNGIIASTYSSYFFAKKNEIWNMSLGRTDGVGINPGSTNFLTLSDNDIWDDQGTPSTKYGIAGPCGVQNKFFINRSFGMITAARNLSPIQSDTVIFEPDAMSTSLPSTGHELWNDGLVLSNT